MTKNNMTKTIKEQVKDKVKVERHVYKEYDILGGSRILAGIAGFQDLYGTAELAKFKVVVIDQLEGEILEEDIFYVDKWLSEDSMEDMWHDEIIPWLSKRYRYCSKTFLQMYEMFQLLNLEEIEEEA